MFLCKSLGRCNGLIMASAVIFRLAFRGQGSLVQQTMPIAHCRYLATYRKTTFLVKVLFLFSSKDILRRTIEGYWNSLHFNTVEKIFYILYLIQMKNVKWNLRVTDYDTVPHKCNNHLYRTLANVKICFYTFAANRTWSLFTFLL